MEHGGLEQLISVIFTSQRALHERMKRELGTTLSSFLQMETLRYVTERDNPPMKEIAQYLSVTPPSATSLINTLVKSGQLERIRDKDDRRMVRLEVTIKGKRVLEEMRENMLAYMRKDLSVLTQEEIIQFTNILKKLSKN